LMSISTPSKKCYDCIVEDIMDLQSLLNSRRDQILKAAQQHGAYNVRLFGSVARGEADDQSDIDLLVCFKPEFSLFDHAALVVELEQILGCKVDVISEDGLYPRVHPDRVQANILKDAVPLWRKPERSMEHGRE
jgi:predicted nucleotidyltransferase